MDSLDVTTTLTREDWIALLRQTQMRARERARRESPWLRWFPFVSWVALVVAIALVFGIWPGAFDLLSLVAGFLTLSLFMIVLAQLQRRASQPAEDGAFLGRTEFRFMAEGIEVTRVGSRGHIAWSLVRDITHTPAHLFIWIDHLAAYVVRVADLPPAMTMEEAVARLRALRDGAASAPPPAEVAPGIATDTLAAPTSATRPETPTGKPTVWRELIALFRVETMRPVESGHLFGRDGTILLLGVLSLALWIGLDRFNYGPGAAFMWLGLASIGTTVCVALLHAWLLARLSSPPLPLRRTLLLVAAASPLIAVIAWLGNLSGGQIQDLLFAVMLVWIALLVHTGLVAMTGRRQLRAVGVAIVALLLATYSWQWINPAVMGFWYAPEEDFDYSDESLAKREQLQFEQAPRIDAAVAAMPAGDPARPAVYFVGFGGYGEQRVFAEEIATATRVVGEKFHTDGRELRLVNDRRDQSAWPLASVSALRHGLISLGRRMNADEDVLFLALSSHGGKDATLSVLNTDMQYWRDLTAQDLRGMLDESGIRWRVIVISACYSGSFIETLANDETIVLTAASKDDTSFGCSDDRDLTYFGEAFYRDALPGAASLREAFDRTRAAIAERERTEGRSESNPQAHFGATLEAKLAQLGK